MKRTPVREEGKVTRRRFMSSSLIFSGIAFALGWAPRRAWSFFVNQFPVRTVEVGLFRFQPDKGTVAVAKRGETPYELTVDGEVEEKAVFTYDDLKKFNQVTQVSDFHCVEGWSVADLEWTGFRFSELLKRVKPKPEAKYAVFHSLGKTSSWPEGLDHYRETFPVAMLLDPEKECLLALSRDGKPLDHDHGAPLRVIAPYELAYKSIKFVTRVEFSKRKQQGWWTLENPIYPVDAPVPASRLRKKRAESSS